MKIDENKNRWPDKEKQIQTQWEQITTKGFYYLETPKEKRNIQIVLDKLQIEYWQLYQKVNNLDYFIETNSTKIINKNYQKGAPLYQRFEYLKIKGVSKKHIPLLIEQREVMLRYLNILQARINDLSKQFKEDK